MKKVKGIVISILVAFVCILAMPFSVYADEYENVNIVTANILGISLMSQDSFAATFIVTMDDYYVGTMTLRVTCYLTDNTSEYKDIAFAFNGQYGYGTGVYGTKIQSITSFKNIRSQSMKRALNSQQYYFPYESSNFIIETAGRGYQQVDLYNLGKWTLPIFKLSSGDELTYKYLSGSPESANHTMTMIIWFNKNNVSLSSTFTIENGQIDSYEQLNVWTYNGVAGTRMAKYVISADTSTTSYKNVYVRAATDVLVMPIYIKRGSEMGFESQDFCDNFGLPYKGLTTEQEQTADDLIDDSDDMQDSFDDMFTIENQYNQDLNNQIDNIDFTNPLSGNQSLLSSGNFVIQVFNGLITNNPISLLIIIACILLVARRLFG